VPICQPVFSLFIVRNEPCQKFWQFNLAHCSLSKISIYDEGAIINLLNDTSHNFE